MSDSVRPYRQQPTRLPYPWDSPGKNTGVGCHFLLQRMKVKSESEVTQSCPMEYYSAIKKNAFESVLMRLMKLEPIIQGEINQKEKHLQYINAYIWNLERW